MNWQQSMAWLESLGQFGSRPGLERINQVLDILGHPERELDVIHVAGTNGKGSVCTFISSVLTAAGYRTGLYTSPHLTAYTERFQIDGVAAPKEELAQYFTQVRSAIDMLQADRNLVLTEFEVLTVVAFLYFAARRVDCLVLEVGMGGRLDATNVVTPKLAVITRIGLDHMGVLGDTLAAIAREKAGIIKTQVPVVLGAQEPEAAAALRSMAKEKKAAVYAAEDLVSVYSKEYDLSGQRFDIKLSDCLLPDLSIKLLGPHQLENTATAVCALQALSDQGISVSDDALRRGLAEASWPGRFEVIKKEPLAIVDGAHNPDGAEALVRTVGEYLDGSQRLLVLGVLEDKDVNSILKVFATIARKAIVTRPESPRAAKPEEVAARLKVLGVDAIVEPDISLAVDKALSLARPQDVVLVCGSLYLAGKARTHLLETNLPYCQYGHRSGSKQV